MIKWSNIKDFNDSKNTDLVNSINEQKLEQKKIVFLFEEKMKIFATERSMESSLDVLNISMQLANIRGNLNRSFEQYVRNLEEEIVKLNRIIEKNQKSSDL
ncbi:MAG: hypothetical protein QOK90_00360 [Nitrososphaeraceae archaeon]|jgi:hypothetical protein|nr:hypothetical protein [Nitrososphaeraceae archaeon]MDW3610556.1 hypothetical protein [Nitrososphaeraceae archaeon]